MNTEQMMVMAQLEKLMREYTCAVERVGYALDGMAEAYRERTAVLGATPRVQHKRRARAVR